jgi:hypothetical protein
MTMLSAHTGTALFIAKGGAMRFVVVVRAIIADAGVVESPTKQTSKSFYQFLHLKPILFVHLAGTFSGAQERNKKGKTCKTAHIEESYFVMSHEYSPISY